MMAALGHRLARLRAECEGGSAIVEFVFVAVMVLVPLVYLIVAVAVVQRSRLAVTNAARDVGRAVASADSSAEADDRAAVALRIALKNQGYSPSEVQVRYVQAGAGCEASAITPTLTAGSAFAVCVVRRQGLPAVPTLVSGRGVTTIGRYVVHMDDFRTMS
jgi:Flp pilus assembly protein TadG